MLPSATPYLAPSTNNSSTVSSGKGRKSKAALSTTLHESTGQSKKKNFSYNHQHEKYLAKIFAEPRTWELLNGPGEKNAYYMNKVAVRESIAKRFNEKFSTHDRPVSLDENQIKNKLRTMKQTWKAGLKEYKKTGNGNLPQSELEERVKRLCHFFFILYERWSVTISLNPPTPTQLTGNITRLTSSVAHDSDEDDEEEEDEEGEEDDGNGSDDGQDSLAGDDSMTNNRQGSSISNSLPSLTAPVKKKRSAVPDHGSLMLEGLSEQAEEGLNLKRRKIELEEKTQIKQEMLLDLQIKKLESELKVSDEIQKLDLENEKYKRETEKLRLQAERKRVLAELSQSWIEIDVTKSTTGQPEKATVRVHSTSPPQSPSKE